MASNYGVRSDRTPVDTRVDTRRWSQRMAQLWSEADGGMMLAGTLAGVNIVMPVIPLGNVLSSAITWFLARKFLYPKERMYNLPFRMPKYLETPDGSSQIIPGLDFKKNKKAYYGKGVTMFGYDYQNNQQVWGTDSDNRTHATILGTTGSGKTEMIHALLVNQLVEDSGFIAVDAKGDISFQRRVCQLLRQFGREDDLLTISFIMGDRDPLEPQTARATNTFNIMSSTSTGMLIELLAGMLDSGGGGGDMWQGRAIAFIAAVTRPLTYLRDKGELDLSPNKYMDYMELNEIERLVYDKGDGGEKYQGFDQVLKPLRSYLMTLPGYNPNKRGEQETTTNEQFGYITMQLTRALNDLSYNYGHIFGIEVGEIDISDVVFNRRCLTVLLPSLARSLASLNMLGKLIIGSIKQMMAGSLGSELSGLIRINVDSRPTTAKNSFRIILDEVGYMMVTGMSVIPAQARSLGISMVFAAQSFTDIKRGSPEEAEAIWENSNIKFIGRIVGGTTSETWQKVQGVAGEREQTAITSYEQTEGKFGLGWKQGQTVSIERRSRVDWDDISGQENGQFTMIVPKKLDGGENQQPAVIRFWGLYTASNVEATHMYINDLIPVSVTEPVRMDEITRSDRIYENMVTGEFFQHIHLIGTNPPAHRNELVDYLNNTQSQIDNINDTMFDNPVVDFAFSNIANYFTQLQDVIPVDDAMPFNRLDNAEQSRILTSLVDINSKNTGVDINCLEQQPMPVLDATYAPLSFDTNIENNEMNGVLLNRFDVEQADLAQRIANSEFTGESLDDIHAQIIQRDSIMRSVLSLDNPHGSIDAPIPESSDHAINHLKTALEFDQRDTRRKLHDDRGIKAEPVYDIMQNFVTKDSPVSVDEDDIDALSMGTGNPLEDIDDDYFKNNI